ncbi:MAG: TIGR01440 family protein [Bacillota bacterium]
MEFEKIKNDLDIALTEFIKEADLKPKDIFVIGCSTSEIKGDKIGKASSLDIAEHLYPVISKQMVQHDLFAAFQGCEHINRALTISEECRKYYNLEAVTVIPHPDAGGAMAATAYKKMENPVVVENIQAVAGIDIGDTFIGMHLKPVAVPVRTSIKTIGKAHFTAARTRPKLIGGRRAHYPEK